MLDQVAGAEQSSSSEPVAEPARQPVQEAPQTPAQGHDDPWAQLDAVAGNDPAAAPTAPQKVPAAEYTHNLQLLMDDAKYSADDISDYITSSGYYLADDQRKHLDNRQEFIAKNGSAPAIKIELVDNQAQVDADAKNGGAFASGVRGAADSVTLGFLDEAGAVADTLGLTNGRKNLWNSPESFGDLYAENRDENRKILRQDEQFHGGARLTGQLVGGLASLPVSAGASLAKVTGVAAAQGAAYGLGSGEGSFENQAKSALVGGTVGAVVGNVGGRAARAFETLRPTATTVRGREVLDAASRLSRDDIRINPTPADVGGTVSRGATGVANQGLASGALIGARRGANLDATEAALTRATDSLIPGGGTTGALNDVAGSVSGPQGLGGIANRARQEADHAYGTAEQLAGDTRVQVPQTLAALDQQIAKLQAVPGGVAGLDRLVALRASLAGDHSVAGLRQLRTTFGDQLDVTNRTAREAARNLWGPLSDDIAGGLSAAGKADAAQAYKAADTAYAQSREQIRNVVRPVIGREGERSVEQVGSKLKSLARTDGEGLAQTLSAMSPEVAGSTRAAILRDLGNANAGAQDHTGTAFSQNTFLTNWMKLGDAGKDALAPLGTQARQDIDDIVRLSSTARQTGQFANHSNTARALHGLSMAAKLGSGAAGWASLGKTVVLEGAVGGILSSDHVARGMVAMGEARPVAKTALRSLSVMPREQAAVQSQLGLHDPVNPQNKQP